MIVTIEITDETQLEQVETLRGDQSLEEFIAVCFEDGLKVAEFKRSQGKRAADAVKHPLFLFPEAKTEFKGLDEAAIATALKEKDPADPVTIELTRLVTAYMAQVNDYARQHGNRLPAAAHVNPLKAPIEKFAFQIAAGAIRSAMQKACNASSTSSAAA
jgi:hypothetical protein